MVKNRNKIKQTKMESEDVTQVRNLIILLVVVVLVCVGIFFLTDSMIKRENNKSDTLEEVKINYDIATVGTMFNRIEEEYYVLLYSSKEDGTSLDGVLSTYRSSDNYLKTYFVDLDLKINNVLGNELVKKPKNSKEVKVNGATLYKIKNGTVLECISGIDDITNVLK